MPRIWREAQKPKKKRNKSSTWTLDLNFEVPPEMVMSDDEVIETMLLVRQIFIAYMCRHSFSLSVQLTCIPPLPLVLWTTSTLPATLSSRSGDLALPRFGMIPWECLKMDMALTMGSN